jgi:hypothetical protein
MIATVQLQSQERFLDEIVRVIDTPAAVAQESSELEA